MYYTSVLGAECIALLCSVSRVASASFSFLIFNDVLVNMYVLVSSTLTRIYAEVEHGFSFFQVKMFTGSVSVLLTGTSLKIKN